MKMTTHFLYLSVAVLLSVSASAALYDRGSGMIYDDVLNITWLQDANYAQTSGYDSDGLMTWTDANSWAANLSYAGYDDWRLPSINNVGIGEGSFTELYGTSYIGEIGYMYFINLGNESSQVNPACLIPPTGCLHNSSFIDSVDGDLVLFANIEQIIREYWYSEKVPFDVPFLTEAAYIFAMGNGVEAVNSSGGENYSWAVRNGDVSQVPLPAAIWLFGVALIGLARMKQKVKSESPLLA